MKVFKGERTRYIRNPANRGKYGKPGQPRKKRSDGWGKETVLRELSEDHSLGISKLCARYIVEPGQSIRGLTHDISNWRRSDPDFEAELSRLLHVPGRPNQKHQGVEWWRRRSEEIAMTNPDWKLDFVRSIYETGSRLKAAALSPYSYEHIYRMLTETYSEYDKDFSEMVHTAEMKMCAELEGGIVDAFREAKNPKDKAWIAKTYLERRDPMRWGKQVEMIHSGKIEHDHKHQHSLKPRDERLKDLFADQKEFFEKGAEPLGLPAEGETSLTLSADVLDAEYVVVEREEPAEQEEPEELEIEE